MEWRWYWVCITCVILFSTTSFQASCGYSGAPDNEGVEFIFAFGPNDDIGYTGSSSLEVFITTKRSSIVTFNYTKHGTIVYGTVAAGEIFSYTADDTSRMTDEQGAKIEPKAQIIQADDEIIVYASNKVKYSADGFLVLPTDVLANEYYVPCWASLDSPGGAMINVVAIEDGTTFNITQQGSIIVTNTVLNRGEVFQYLGASNADDDLTGARVFADKPIGVLSGNSRASIGVVSGTSDHIVEMIPPINSLGRKFLLANFYERRSDIVRVVAAEDSITLTVTKDSFSQAAVVVLTTAGEFVEINTAENEVIYVESTGACIVAQYSKTGGADGASSDPMMAIVPPVEQYSNFYIFTTPSGVSALFRNYVNIIMKSDITDGFRLDDAVITTSLSDHGFGVGDTFNIDCWAQDEWQAISNTGYSARTLAVLHGTHSIYNTNTAVSFYALMYGHVKSESYGFPAGSRLASLGAYCSNSAMTANDGVDNDCDGVIDEEMLNGVDDDGDGLIDEDSSASQFSVTSTTVVPTTATTKIPTTANTTIVPTTTAKTTEIPTTTTTTEIPTTTSTTESRSTTNTTMIPGLSLNSEWTTFQLLCDCMVTDLLVPKGYIIRPSGNQTIMPKREACAMACTMNGTCDCFTFDRVTCNFYELAQLSSVPAQTTVSTRFYRNATVNVSTLISKDMLAEASSSSVYRGNGSTEEPMETEIWNLFDGKKTISECESSGTPQIFKTKFEFEPYVLIELSTSHKIHGVIIWNRAFYENQTLNVEVRVSNDQNGLNRAKSFCSYHDGQINDIQVMICDELIEGRFVQLQMLSVDSYFNLYELELYKHV